MSLRFIYGRAGSGKSYFCFNDIKTKIERGGNAPLILLVPEDYSFKAEKGLLKVVGEKGLMKAEVLSFKRMAYRVFNEAGGLVRRHMNNAGRCILLYRIMDEIKDDFQIFTKAVRMKGFVNTISDIITELKIYGIVPEVLEDAKEKVEDEILKGKLHDINLIYSKFEEAMHKGYIDSEDDLAILANKLDTYNGFDGAEIWVDGFSMFTPQQYLILEKLLKRVERVNITLCGECSGRQYVDRADVFSSIKDMEERILKIAQDNNIPYDKPVKLDGEVPYKFIDNPELAHLERYFYAFPYKVYNQAVSHINIFRAVNRYTEVEHVAQDIISLCRDEGFRFGDIAVVTREIGGYEKLIGTIFKEYGIPYFFDQKRDISSNPLIVLILSAMEILYKNWRYEAVFSYLKTGLTGISMEEVDLLENYVLAAGIKGKRWTDGEVWKYWPDYGYEGELPEDAKEKLAVINDIKGRVCSPLLKLKASLEEGKGARIICASIFQFLCDLGVPERIERLVEGFKNDGELDMAGEYSKVWNIMIETFDQVVEVLSDRDITLEQLSKVLAIGFEEYKIGLIPSALDQVVFGSIERVKNYDIKALYIIGVNDGIFPSSPGDEGVLSDSDRECLKSMGLQLAPGTKDKVFDEQYLVYTALTRSRKYLKICCPIADHEGKAMRPSIIISRLKKIFKNIEEKSNITVEDTDEENIKRINSPLPTLNELVCAMRKNADGHNMNPVWRDVYYWYINNDKWRDKAQRAVSGLTYVNQVKPINPSRARELYGKTLKFSISRLEKYAQCPFSYFMQYGLKAKERKVYELSPPDLGSFIHMVLDGFAGYLDENDIEWRSLEKDECSNIISSLVDDTVDKMAGSILSSSARYKYLKERLKRIIFRAVWLIVLHIKRGGFEPVDHEVGFENGGKYPPISIDLPSGDKVSLIGRIDRVDMLENEEGIYVRIVDYKSGNKSFNLSDIYNGLELQLLIYLDAILEYVSKKSKKPVFPGGILYFKVADPIISAKGEMSDEEAENEIIKQLKMKGLLLSDVKIVREMDREISGYSMIIPANIKTGGSFGLNSSIATADDFEALRKHVKRKIISLCEDMLKGNISISPCKKKNDTPCKYCSFKPVCRFDVSIKENSYRIITDRTKDEIWEALRKGGNDDGMDA